MIVTQEAGPEPARTSTFTWPLVVCAALGLGTFATAQLFVLDQLAVLAIDAEDVSEYTWFGVLVLALLVWHLSPRWSWPALLGLGALCALPTHVRLLSDSFEPWMRIPYVAIDAASRPLLLVGLLGAAAAVWRAGRRAIGTALLGAPLIVPPLMTFVVATFANDEAVDEAEFLPVTGLVLAVATIIATIAAVAGRWC